MTPVADPLGRRLVHLGLILVSLAICSCQSIVLNQLGAGDSVHLAVIRATNECLQCRLMPATAATGKKSLTLDDCRRIALAKNLELQLARVEEITRAALRDSNQKKMLPHLLLTGELGERDNLGFTYSDVIGQEGRNPGTAEAAGSTGVTNYSVGHERTTWRYNLELRWSPNDAALAYYLSKSGGNDRLRAHYQRVRVAQKLIGTVESAYFRLLASQKLLPMAVRLKSLRKTVLEETEHLYAKKMKSVEEYQQAKQGFLRAARTLLVIQDGFERQRNILSTAMRLSPEYRAECGFYVTGELTAPSFHAGIPHLEMTAVKNRPESWEAGLNYLNSVNDVRRTIIKYFPKFSGYWRYTRDKDQFLFNKDWKEIGVRATFDLTDWITNVDESEAARSNSAKAEGELGAVALGITSQVREAALRYYRSVGELASVEASFKISRKVLETARLRAGSDDTTKLALLQAEASSLLEEIDRIQAIGEAKANLAELMTALGTNYQEPHPKI